MLRFLADVPDPAKRLCSASYVQPHECKLLLNTPEQRRLLEGLLPETLARVRGIFDVLIANHTEYGFGEDHVIDGGEFVAIRRWRHPQSLECVFSRLFTVAAKYVDDDSVEGCQCGKLQPVELDAKQQSLSSCWLRCMYTAIVQHMPKEHIREVVFDHSSPCPAAPPYAFLRGPVAYVLGLDSLWSSLRAWVTIACVNVSLYNGYHDWHVDGPSLDPATGLERGRYHKAFFMIAKEGAHDAYRTNLRVASNEFKVPGQYDTRGQPIWRSLPKAKPTWFSEDASNGDSWWDRLSNWRYWRWPWKLWGVRDDWDDIEQAGCNVPMLPGDLLITREDVWHRTQDIEQDRYLFKLDVRRSPIANDMREASIIGDARFGISEASDATLLVSGSGSVEHLPKDR